jgi:protein TonB
VTGKHWCIALLGAILLHGAVAAALLWEPPKVGASGAGAGGIEISLGPAGGAPGSTPTAVADAEEVETLDAAEAQEAPQPDSAIARDEPVETADPSEVTEVRAADPAESMAEAVPVEAETVEAEEMESPEAISAKPREAEKVDTPEVETVARSQIADAVEAVETLPPLPEARPRNLAQPTQKLEPRPQPEKKQVAEAAAGPANPEAEQTAKAASSTPGSQGKAGSADSAEAGSASASSGGGTPGEVADYMARLQAWLERHKEYPRRAKLRRQEGTVVLYFVMNREGRVLEYRLRRSSGHASLDHAVEEMIERAQPLPKMPQEMRQARLELVVPVQFYLR